MNTASEQPRPSPEEVKRRPFRVSLEAALSLLIFLLVVVMTFGYLIFYQSRIGIKQPIPFSHRFHVTGKKISCLLCHPGAVQTSSAQIPPLETCMLCHEKIAIYYTEMVRMKNFYSEGKPVSWVRINYLPDFVFFSHQVHTRRGFDCSKCHGDVAHQDRIRPVRKFKMGFCVQCHRDENFSHDCFICHR
jgi:hypothetical protein